MMTKNLRAYFELSLAMFIVGSSVVVGKLLVDNIPVFLISGLRFAISSLILFPILIKYEGLTFLTINKKDWLILGLQSFTGVFLFNILLLNGLKYTNAIESGIILGTTPAIIALISLLFLKEKMSLYKWLGILLSVIGIIIINVFGSNVTLGDKSFSFWGNLLILGAVVCEALFTIFRKVSSNKVTPLLTATAVSIIGLILFLPFSIYDALNFDFSTITILDWLYILYFGLFVTVIAFLLWFHGVSKVSASTAGVFSSVMPVSAVILSSIILKEEITIINLLGITCILLAILIFTKKQ